MNKTAKEGPLLIHRSGKAIGICIAVIVGLTVADLASKSWVVDALSLERMGEQPPICDPDGDGFIRMQRMRGEPIVLIDGYLEFRYAENCGAAFGIMREAPMIARQLLFGVAAVLASIALLVMFVRGRGQMLFAIAVPLIVSGAIGNLVDRLRLGYVVDFIRFHLQDGWEWPTFNIADCGITVGVVLLVLDGIRDSRRHAVQQAERAEAATKTGAQPSDE